MKQERTLFLSDMAACDEAVRRQDAVLAAKLLAIEVVRILAPLFSR